VADENIDDDRIAAVCRVLLDHHLEFVVIGGAASVMAIALAIEGSSSSKARCIIASPCLML